MPINQLTMTQFRNYNYAQIEFAPKMNILFGPNGSGKTTVLEAIHCLTVTKSFRSPYDKPLVQHGEEFYQLKGELSNDDHRDTVQLNYVINQGKKLFINSQEQEKLSRIVGEYPTVTLTPEDSEITFGPPAIRRKYINKIMSQASPVHMRLLMRLQSVLKQRNSILQEAADMPGAIDETLLSVFDDQLLEVSAKIEIARQKFITHFQPSFQSIYADIYGGARQVQLRFSPSVRYENDSQFTRDFMENLQSRRAQELGFRRTVVGPQSDGYELYLDGRSLRQYGSQGEHKLVLIALKLAEGRYLKEQKGRAPIFLLDDLFAELDVERSKKVLQAIENPGQIIITSTDLADVRHHNIDISGKDVTVFDISEITSPENK